MSATNTGLWRKKPVVISAYQLPAANEDVPDSFHEWCSLVGFENWTSDRDQGLTIATLEGVMRADPGDWIIKGVKGEFYPCKPDIFSATYEPAAELAEPVPDKGTPGPWFVRKLMRDGEMQECFVAAPDCQGLPYGAEILGDDEYREDLQRMLADCELIVAAVNAYRAGALQDVTTLQRDADRYRYLRETTNWISSSNSSKASVKGNPALFDAACDLGIARRAAEKTPGGQS